MTTDCKFKGADPICSKCGRMVPDACALTEEDTSSLAGTVKALTQEEPALTQAEPDLTRVEPALTQVEPALESSQEPTGESEGSEATEVAEGSQEATTEPETKPTGRKGRRAS